MPVSGISVTEGSGKVLNAWQRSVSSVNREEQIVQIGESGQTTFTACATSVSCATTDAHLMQIMSGASTYTRIKRVTLAQNGAAGATGVCAVYLYRLTSAGTGGTEITPRPFDSADTVAATAMTLPSTKGDQGVLLWADTFQLSSTTGGGRWTWEAKDGDKPIIIPTGTSNGFVVRIGTGVATTPTVMVTVEFTETAWL